MRDSTTRLQGRKQSQAFKSANNNKIAARCSRQEWKKKKFSYSKFSCLDPRHLQCKQEFSQCLVSTPALSSLHSTRDPGSPWGAAAPGQGSPKPALSPWSPSQARRRGIPMDLSRTGQAKVSDSLSVLHLHPLGCALSWVWGIWDIPDVPSSPVLVGFCPFHGVRGCSGSWGGVWISCGHPWESPVV